MLFNSLPFYIFFPLVTLGYFLLPHRWRWMWLLAASAYFYMAFVPAYILILLLTILVDYVAGIAIERSEGRRRKIIFIAGLIANLGALGFFKYFNFFNANFAAIADWLGLRYPIPMLEIILPIGLSFYTFKSLSYLIEVNRGDQKAERHIGLLALYVMFYPQLIAGPIERPQHLLPQFREDHRFEPAQAADGLRRMAWGYFKKLVIADRLALLVNPIFSDPRSYPGPLLLLAAVAFTYQIYCDFSGYSDIALGAARVLGFRLVENFNRPYAARSLAEFWQRWHISLSSWLRDYTFFPVRRSLLRRETQLPDWLNQFLPTMVTMLASGLWHGANWTFILWGALHGLYLALELWTANLRETVALRLGLARLAWLRHACQTLVTFTLVALAWTFFRADSVSDAFYIIGHFFRGWDLSQLSLWLDQIRVTLGENFPLAILFSSLTGAQVLVIVGLQVILLEVVQALSKDKPIERVLAGQNFILRWSAYYFLLGNILLFGAFQQTTFIYFQF
jgi:D-alanyl-lipoteichoic acid acyltransferase DltB (MBOAT superfamily)